MRNVISQVARFIEWLLHLAARPVRREGGLIIQPYRGYGARDDVFLMGRVFRQPEFGARLRRHTLFRALVDVVRRALRWGVADAKIVARLGGSEHRTTTGKDGYFRFRLHPEALPADEGPWHDVQLQLIEPAGAEEGVTGVVYVPPEEARRVIISDIDDTVVYTGVADKLKMLWRLFMRGAQSRVAFPGVAALYRALHQGRSGDEKNPMLYVSRGPWSLYDVLDTFFDLHEIPVGPVLFLRDWGLTLQRPFPRRSRDHKLTLIRDMLSLYDDLPFVLIGDSGQHDPEIYTEIVQEHPGRIEAVYIRNVTPDPERQQAIEVLAEEVAEVGSSLVLASDSYAMAEHAAEHGLIAPERLQEILRERRAQEGTAALKPTKDIKRPSPEETERALEEGELDEALEDVTGRDEAPNVVVEPESDR